MRRRALLALGCLGAVGVWTPQVFAQIPGVQVPTVTVPSLPLETPSLPSVTPAPPPALPPAPPPISAPPPPSLPPAPALPALPGGSGSGSGEATQSSEPAVDSGGASSSPSGSGPDPRGAIASRSDPRLHVWPAKFRNRARDRERAATTLTFWLSRAGVIRLVVRQEAPVCRVWGALAVRGERGVNRVRFTGRVGGELLPAGTYRVRAEALRRGAVRPLGAVTLVIVAPSEPIAKARAQPTTCAAEIARVTDEEIAAASSPAGRSSPSGKAKTGGEVASATASADEAATALVRRRPLDDEGASVIGSLPNPFRAAPLWLQPFLLGMLGVAIILLQLAALPARVVPSTGAALFVSRHRPELALGGMGLLGAVAVAAILL